MVLFLFAECSISEGYLVSLALYVSWVTLQNTNQNGFVAVTFFTTRISRQPEFQVAANQLRAHDKLSTPNMSATSQREHMVTRSPSTPNQPVVLMNRFRISCDLFPLPPHSTPFSPHRLL